MEGKWGRNAQMGVEEGGEEEEGHSGCFSIVQLHFCPAHSRQAPMACLGPPPCFPQSASYPDAGRTRPPWSLVSDPFPHWVLYWLSFPSTSVPLGLYCPFLPLWTWWCGAQHPACGWTLSPSILYLPGLMTSDTVFRLRNLPCIRLI